MRANALGVQAWIAAAFYLFILASSNPFLRIASAPAEGRDLNPLLQDIGLAIHPPFLYLGYVGFSISFSFAIAALIEGRIDAAWARYVRPWVLTAWIFMTLGIAMGSYWAYYELGWGGWWFWDPVENASLMPWIAGTALLHSAVVMEKRDALKVWTILLAILCFSLSLIGTFLVRSGVLTSVHSFATDPTRGVFILAILVFFIGGALALYAWRAPALRQGGIFAPISREGALVFNNLFLTTACATVFIGTLYPLALEAVTGEKISVGAPFFNATFAPLAIPLLIAVPFGPLLSWKRGDLLGAAQRLMAALAVASGVAAVFVINGGGPVVAPFAIGLALYVMTGALVDLAERTQALRQPWPFRCAAPPGCRARRSARPRAFRRRPPAARCHLRILLWRGTHRDHEAAGDDFHSRLRSVVRRPGVAAGPELSRVDREIHSATRRRDDRHAEPSKRNFTTRGNSTTEAALLTRGFSQLYVSLGEPEPDGSISVRIYHKPLVLLIWFGALVMAFGGLLSLSDRRLRVGAPKPAKKSILQPAE